MTKTFQIGEKLPELVDKVVASYRSHSQTHYIDRRYLPSRSEIIEIIQLLLELAYPGYFGRQDLTQHNVAYHVGELLPRIGMKLFTDLREKYYAGNESYYAS